MGEIDTNPIASVQSALSLFGEKRGHHNRNESISSDDMEKEKVHESMLKDLANFKLQLEAKDLVYNQAIYKLDQSEKTAEELSSLLKKSELEKHFNISQCTEAHRRIEELQSKLKEMADELSKSTMDRYELSNALTEMEIKLAVNREANMETMREMEMMKTKSNRELEKFLELKEAYMNLNSNAERAYNLLSEKEGELELALKAGSEMEEELKNAKCKLENLHELERQLANKDSLYSEAVSELNKLKSEMQTKAEVEIAMLKSELHKWRSRIASAEAGEERAKIEKAELFLAVQQLALEIEEVKQENKTPLMVDESIEEEMIRKELEMARTKIWELRNMAEQAGIRAEEAEKAKAEMEGRITKRREKRERRLAALAALKEETFSSSSNNNKTDQPLGKLLNFKLKS